jgi:hypothetical protein
VCSGVPAHVSQRNTRLPAQKAVPVLLTGTSRRQTASPGSNSPVPGTIASPRCQRMQPNRRRKILLLRRPEKSHVMTIALHNSIGYAVFSSPDVRLGPLYGRSSASMFKPAQTSLAQISSAMTRGLGPIRPTRFLRAVRWRMGSNLRGISSHSCRLRKKMRRAAIRPARVLGAKICRGPSHALDQYCTSHHRATGIRRRLVRRQGLLPPGFNSTPRW